MSIPIHTHFSQKIISLLLNKIAKIQGQRNIQLRRQLCFPFLLNALDPVTAKQKKLGKRARFSNGWQTQEAHLFNFIQVLVIFLQLNFGRFSFDKERLELNCVLCNYYTSERIHPWSAGPLDFLTAKNIAKVRWKFQLGTDENSPGSIINT